MSWRFVAAAGSAAFVVAHAAHADQVYTASNGVYTTDNPAAFTAWLADTAAAGAVWYGFENFDSYNGGPDIDFPSGSTTILPSGLQIYYEETPDASSAASAGIDSSVNLWTGAPPFEGSAAFDAYILVPGGQNASGTNIVQFILPQPIIGFAMDLEGPASGGDLTLTINGVTISVNDYFGSSDDGIFAYMADSPFTVITFGAENLGWAGETFSLDNFHFAVIPAPSTFGLALAGALCGLRRRR